MAAPLAGRGGLQTAPGDTSTIATGILRWSAVVNAMPGCHWTQNVLCLHLSRGEMPIQIFCLHFYTLCFISPPLPLSVSVSVSVCLSVSVSVCLSVSVSVSLSLSLSLFVTVYLSICLFVFLSFCISVFLSLLLSLSLSLSLSLFLFMSQGPSVSLSL